MKLGRQRLRATVSRKFNIHYLLRDKFVTDVSAGSIDGTNGEPGPGTRSVVDTGSNLSISESELAVAGTAGAADPILAYSEAITRVAGRIGVVRLDPEYRWKIGFSSSPSTAPKISAFGVVAAYTILYAYDNADIQVGLISNITDIYYEFAFVLRTSGSFLFIKGGKQYSYWTLLWVGDVDTTSPLYFVALSSSLGSGQSVSDTYVYDNYLWLPTPLISDGFSTSTSDGLGHPEGITGGLGVGGSGGSWTAQVGTWGVGSGIRSCSALDTGVGINTIDVGVTDTVYSAELTRSGGNIGIVVRWVDINNYIYAYHDGTNVTLRKVVGGVDSEVIAPAARTYDANKKLTLYCYGTNFRLFYGTQKITTVVTISDVTLQSGTEVGLYTTNTDNTFDNVLVYARGKEGEYDSYFSRTPSVPPETSTVSVPDGGNIADYISQMKDGDILSLAENGNYSASDFSALPNGYFDKKTIVYGNGATITGGAIGLDLADKVDIDLHDINWIDNTTYSVKYNRCARINQYDCTYKSTVGYSLTDVLKIFKSNDLLFDTCTVKSTTGGGTCDGFEFWGKCINIICRDCIVEGIDGGGGGDNHGFESYGSDVDEINENIKWLRCDAKNCVVGFSNEGGPNSIDHIEVVMDACTYSNNSNYDVQGVQGSTLYIENQTTSPGTNGSVTVRS